MATQVALGNGCFKNIRGKDRPLRSCPDDVSTGWQRLCAFTLSDDMTLGMFSRSFTLCALVLAATFVSICAGCSGGEAGQNDDFHRGRGHVIDGKYDVAIPLLQRFLSRQGNSRNASRAGLFLGKAHLGRGALDEAYNTFKATAQNYPNTLEAHKCQYKLAFVDMLRGNDDAAIEKFSQLADQPDGPLVPEATVMRDYLSNR